MTKRVAIVQSNYIPWKGYFDLINSVDEFILFDDRQYTRRDWRNRNVIKTAQGPVWLTIPVKVKGGYQSQTIQETQVSDSQWNVNHWRTIVHHYSKAPYFKEYRDRLEELYLSATYEYLSQINYHFLKTICDWLDIRTTLSWSTDYNAADGKVERLISLCQQAHADHYISGPAAKAYIGEEQFAHAGIQLEYANYDDYPEYGQLHPPFIHGVSIIDLLLNEGKRSAQYMKSFESRAAHVC